MIITVFILNLWSNIVSHFMFAMLKSCQLE